MELSAKFAEGLKYRDFLQTYASAEQLRRWAIVHEQVKLADEQRTLLGGFPRDMKVLCVAGAWCGDCIAQCPIFDHFSSVTERIEVRFFDRDAHPDLAQELAVCGAPRVPAVLFLSEDWFPVARYGDRTLARYRQLAVDQLGEACPSGVKAPESSVLQAVTQEWLNEFERVQLILRTSGRLRQLHGD
jgi:hypothetical protein